MRRICTFYLFFICLTVWAGRPKVGLVLGGGGAKGAAEVGVLKVIERAGIPIDYIAGTSIGSIVGGLYAAGYRAEELDTMFRTQEWLSLLTDRKTGFGNEPYLEKDGVTYIFGFPVLDKNKQESGGFGMVRGTKIEQTVDSMIARKGCKSFETLRIPFRCIAADFIHAEEVVLDKGRLSKAIRASMAIPGVFKPVNWEGKKLVDGGMMNNLPVDVVKQMGADFVIAIDLQQKDETPRKQENTSMLGTIGNLFGIGGLLDWVTYRPDIEKHKRNIKESDIYINPPLPDYDASSFGNKNSERMILIGEQAALKHWDKLMKLKKQILKQL